MTSSLLAGFMKVTLIIFFVCCVTSSNPLLHAETNSLGTSSRSLNFVQDIKVSLPEIEKLWPSEPETYLRYSKQAVSILAGATNRVLAQSVMLAVWTNVMEKNLPTNELQILSCIEVKWETIRIYLNQEGFSEDKSRLVDAAKFIGEIRSRIITNYVNQGKKLSISMPDHPETVRRLVEENARNIITDNVQQELRIRNWMYANDLLGNVPFPKRKDDKFIEAFSQAAQLTGDEIKQLKAKYD